MNPVELQQTRQSRRQFLNRTSMGLGATVLGSLVAQQATAAGKSGLHFPPRAKRVIFLFMAGAPSQLDLFDYKPQLGKQFRKPLPESVSMGQRVTAMTKGKTQLVAPSMFKFHRKGQNGIWMCELFPHLSEVADDLCIIAGCASCCRICRPLRMISASSTRCIPTRSIMIPRRHLSAPVRRSRGRRAWELG